MLRLLPLAFPAPAPSLLLICSAPAYLLLPYSCSVPTSALLLPCPASALPGTSLVQPCFFPAPAPAHPSLAAFIIISTLRLFFGTARAAFYGNSFQIVFISGIRAREMRREGARRENEARAKTILAARRSAAKTKAKFDVHALYMIALSTI